MTYQPYRANLGDWAASQAYWNSIPWWQKLSPVPAIKAAALLAQPAATNEQKYGVVPLPQPVDQPSVSNIPWIPISIGAALLAVTGGYLYYAKKHKKVVATI